MRLQRALKPDACSKPSHIHSLPHIQNLCFLLCASRQNMAAARAGGRRQVRDGGNRFVLRVFSELSGGAKCRRRG